ncbi:MAG: VanZ family protein [Burkholderiaceae bacterium]
MSESALTHPAHTPASPSTAAKASALARIGLLFYMLLVVYASWYPLSGWRDNGLLPWSYLFEHMPRYWTRFDFAANVLGYIPLGALAVLALYPLLRTLPALVLTLVCGLLLTVLMEAVQTYLPTRVASNLDVLTNTLGLAIGAGLGSWARRYVLEQSRLRMLRDHWFSDQASRGLIVIGLWPLAQIYPQAYLFGHGQVLPTLSAWLTDWLDTPVDLSQLFWSEYNVSVEQYLLAEVIITACCMTGAVLTLLCQMRSNAPKIRMALLLVLSALAVKAMASAILFTPDNAFTWFTPSAAGGLLIGAIMLGGLSYAPPLAQRHTAILSLLVCLLVLNLAPANPYFLSTLQDWVQGKFLNFNGAAQFLSLIWPFFALWFLTHRTHREA